MCISCKTHEPLSPHDLSTGHHKLGVSFITSLNSNLCTTLTTQMTIKVTYYLIHTKEDCTSAHLFLTGTRCLLVTHNGRSDFPSANYYQGQVQIPQFTICELFGAMYLKFLTCSASEEVLRAFSLICNTFWKWPSSLSILILSRS